MPERTLRVRLRSLQAPAGSCVLAATRLTFSADGRSVTGASACDVVACDACALGCGALPPASLRKLG